MASLKRSKTMLADGQTAKFLYTILKQLDLKSSCFTYQKVDWSLVASQLDITNGHAARMRFSRFRQHMEGIQTNHRGSRQKKPKTEKAAAQSKKLPFEEQKPQSDMPQVKPEPTVKPEFPVDPLMNCSNPLASSGLYTSSPYHMPTVAPSDLTLRHPTPPQPIGYAVPPIGENLPRVKTEQIDSGLAFQGSLVKAEPSSII